MIDAGSLRRVAVAAALSGAAHAAIIALGRIDLPQPPPDRLPLAVRMVSVPASAPRATAPPVRPERRSRPNDVALAVAATPPWRPSLEQPGSDEPVETASTAAGETPTSAQAPEPEPVVVATAPPSRPGPEQPPVRRLPRKGHITYDLVYGRDRFPVGRTVQSWEMDAQGYRLASRSETTGIVDLLRSQHRTYFSRGTVTRAGLRPDSFMMSRNRGKRTEEARAHFNWTGATVTLGPAAGQRQETLPARSQDLLSFMYQLSIDPPPPGRLHQVVTNGSRIETYELDVQNEEMIETPLGPMRALPIRQVRRPNEESLALWLAVEYRYVPVRLRFFDRSGEPQGEQIVTEIRLSDE